MLGTKEDMALHKVMVYGTLKRGQPNNRLLTDSSLGYARFYGAARTWHKYPMVLAGDHNAPFILDKPGTGHVSYLYSFKTFVLLVGFIIAYFV